jgi:hypothetical protein
MMGLEENRNDLTNYMEQSPSWEADSHSASQEFPGFYITRNFIIVFTEACPRLCVTYHNKLYFYGQELVAPRPTPKLGDHSCRLSATAHYNIKLSGEEWHVIMCDYACILSVIIP